MKASFLILGILIFTFLSCGKDEDEQPLCGEPICVKAPSTNPANTSTGNPINYNVELSTSNYIDSVSFFYQVDSSAIPMYKASKDTLFRKVIYPVGTKKNRQFIDGSFVPRKFPPVGKKIYFTIHMFSDTLTKVKTQVFQVL